MTENKPIIIDGVDVSVCEFYCDKYCSLSNDRNEQLLFEEVCSEYSDCLFKQLARKTQECEELKKQLIQKDEVNTFFNTPIDGWDNYPCKICESKQNYDQLKAIKEQAEQKLQKIREFATALCYTVMSDGVVTPQKDILQIIDEVK